MALLTASLRPRGLGGVGMASGGGVGRDTEDEGTKQLNPQVTPMHLGQPLVH